MAWGPGAILSAVAIGLGGGLLLTVAGQRAAAAEPSPRASGDPVPLKSPPAARSALPSQLALLAAAGADEAEPAPPEPSPAVSSTIPQINWFGGTGAANQEALGWMLASENPDRSRLTWFLQALCLNNKARARLSLGITSLRDALQSGVKLGEKTLRKNLGWGPQIDKVTKIKRIAATSAALTQKAVPTRIASFVADLFAGRIDPRELRGLAGEVPPPSSTWSLITDFLQHDNFEATVRAQLGVDATTRVKTEAEKLKDWGNPTFVAEVDGVRYYGRRVRRQGVA